MAQPLRKHHKVQNKVQLNIRRKNINFSQIPMYFSYPLSLQQHSCSMYVLAMRWQIVLAVSFIFVSTSSRTCLVISTAAAFHIWHLFTIFPCGFCFVLASSKQKSSSVLSCSTNHYVSLNDGCQARRIFRTHEFHLSFKDFHLKIH